MRSIQQQEETKKRQATKLLKLLDSMLNEREIKVLTMLNGLDGYAGERDYLTIAKSCGCTRERIRQIEAMALKILELGSREAYRKSKGYS